MREKRNQVEKTSSNPTSSRSRVAVHLLLHDKFVNDLSFTIIVWLLSLVESIHLPLFLSFVNDCDSCVNNQ